RDVEDARDRARAPAEQRLIPIAAQLEAGVAGQFVEEPLLLAGDRQAPAVIPAADALELAPVDDQDLAFLHQRVRLDVELHLVRLDVDAARADVDARLLLAVEEALQGR